MQGIPSVIFDYGVDKRIKEEVGNSNKIYDCVFVGLLGSDEQSNKSELLNFIAEHVDFKWWDPKANKIDKYPFLLDTWQGYTSGVDMLKI